MTKNACLPIISILVQFGGEILAALCSGDYIQTLLILRFDKKARLINGTETTIFEKYPIFRKAQPFFFRV